MKLYLIITLSFIAGYMSVLAQDRAENPVPESKNEHLIESITATKPDYEGSLIVNKLNAKKCFYHVKAVLEDSSYWVPTTKNESMVEAVYFPYKKEYCERGRIFKMILYITTADLPECYLKTYFYSNFKDRPGQLLHTITIVLKDTKKGSYFVTVNIVNDNIRIPTEGLFIAIETPHIPSNEISLYKSDSDNIPVPIIGKPGSNEGYVTSLYYPYLNYMETNDLETAFYIQNNSSWQRVKTEHLFKRKPKYAKPAVSLVLTK